MSVNIKELKNELLFIPLGGTNEIGINVNLYHYLGKWIMVDCGAGFADDSMPGVDVVVADISFITKYKKDLLGIILTHAHEDHLGAIQYLWEDLGCPIYATNFTASFLKSKLGEYSISENIEIKSIKLSSKFDLGPFSIEMVPLAHSAPEMQALLIKTDKGNIFHTGDWKFDHNPLIGKDSDSDQLKKIGKEGILALLSDSTNVFNKENSGSEGDLQKSLYNIIGECKGLVIVTTFASNLARLDSLIRIGQSLKRKIVLTGRSLHRIVAAAQDSGYMKDIDSLIDERDISRHRKNEIMVIATGCQGEPLAAINKIANNTHRSIKLSDGDTVIFSSKIIPGNEKKIFALFNKLVKHKVEVKTERDHFVHVSGHPGIEDIKRMLDYLKPQICIPVHGEPIHIHEHAKIAKENKIKFALEVENGCVVKIDAKDPKIIGKVHSGYLGVDGDYLIPKESPIFSMRKRMSYAGIFTLNMILDKKHHIISSPIINSAGLVDESEDIEFIAIAKERIRQLISELNKQNPHMDQDSIKKAVKSFLKKLIKSELGKEPVITVNIFFI